MIQEARTRKAKAFQGMKSLMSTNKGQLDADQQRQYEGFEKDYNAANAEIDRIEKFQQLEAQQRGNREQQREQDEREMRDNQELTKAEIAKRQKKAFLQYLGAGTTTRSGGVGNVDAELRQYLNFDQRGTTAQKTTPDSSGGYLIDEVLASSIELGQVFVSDMEQACTVITTPTGATINHPKIDDTGTDGALYTEASRDSTAIPVSDMTVGNTALGAYFYSSKWVKLTIEAAQDIEYSLNSFLLPALSERVNRGKNTDLTTGDGSGKPNGIITASSAGVTAASATAITHEELIDTFFSVDRSFRGGQKVAWMCNDAIEKQILKLGLTAAENFNPITFDAQGNIFIMGKRVWSNKDMASSLAANNKVLLFGDFSKYIIRKVSSPAIIFTDQQFIQNGQFGYMAYERVDGDFVGASACLKYLQMAAS